MYEEEREREDDDGDEEAFKMLGKLSTYCDNGRGVSLQSSFPER